MSRSKKTRKVYRSAIPWPSDEVVLRDVFGNPVEWTPGEARTRVRYYDEKGRRVYMRAHLGGGVPDDMREVVERAAQANGVPMIEVVRQCIGQVLGSKKEVRS